MLPRSKRFDVLRKTANVKDGVANPVPLGTVQITTYRLKIDYLPL